MSFKATLSPSMKCVINGCETTLMNMPQGVTFHEFPTNPVVKRSWAAALNNKSSQINWTKSRICTKHFVSRSFLPTGELRETAVPSIFTAKPPENKSVTKTAEAMPLPNKVDRLLTKASNQRLANDVKTTLSLISVPDDYVNCVNDNLQCSPDTPVEAQLWLLIKKQEQLIKRLNQAAEYNKKHVEVLQKNVADNRAVKKELEQSIETYKYTVKCLQEKHATLEEQVEILTSVEAR